MGIFDFLQRPAKISRQELIIKANLLIKDYGFNFYNIDKDINEACDCFVFWFFDKEKKYFNEYEVAILKLIAAESIYENIDLDLIEQFNPLKDKINRIRSIDSSKISSTIYFYDFNFRRRKIPDETILKDSEKKSIEHKKNYISLGCFSLRIPQGIITENNYVEMEHSKQYSINLYNYGSCNCDAEVNIDGKKVGVWRINKKSYIEVERPVNDNGKFTFYKFGSKESDISEVSNDDNLGLITVVFKPEKIEEIITSQASQDVGMPRFSIDPGLRPGGTGLSGISKQCFVDAKKINYDINKFITINVRLGCVNNGPRPLTSCSSTPIPPPLKKIY